GRELRRGDCVRVPSPPGRDRARLRDHVPPRAGAGRIPIVPPPPRGGAPRERTRLCGVPPLATGPAFSIAACWCGDLTAGERVLASLRRLGTPLEDTIRAVPYLEMQSLFAVPSVRVGSYARSSFLRELDDAAIDALVARATTPAPPSLFFLEHLHGRVSSVGADEAAFSHRGPGYSFAAISLWFGPAEAAP